MKKLFLFLTKVPTHKFYSDWTPLEKAWWGMWKAPEDCFSKEDILKLNENFLEIFRKNFKTKQS